MPDQLAEGLPADVDVEPPGWDGCVALTSTLVAIPETERLDALALFIDASIKTTWFTKEPHHG